MPRNAAAYDEDFYAWTQEQARLLRSGEFAQIDIKNVAEELESMGRSDKRELDSRLEVLLTHLLKWQVQINLRPPSWTRTIREQRRRIEKLLRESPSLRPLLPTFISEAYAAARDAAAHETGLSHSFFPVACPYTLEQVLSPEFLPQD